jgi:hypothetical protein
MDPSSWSDAGGVRSLQVLWEDGERVFCRGEHYGDGHRAAGMVFVTLGSLDNPESIEPMLEMFTKRRLKWVKPLDLPQFENMPS